MSAATTPATSRHVLQVLQPVSGGVAAYVAELVRALVARRWRVTVACPPSDLGDALRGEGAELLEVELARAPRPALDARAVRRIAAHCERRGVSVIHGHSSKGGAIAALAGRRVGLPSVYTPHCWPFQMAGQGPLRGAYALAEAYFARRCHTRVVTVAHHERDVALRWRVAPGQRVHVVPTGLEPEWAAESRAEARARLRLPEDAVVAAWIGRHHRAKGPDQLAPAARRLRSAGVLLAALGGGIAASEEGRAFADAGGIAVAEDVPPTRLLSAADLLVQTSTWEGLPLAILEAMRAGLPVVAYGVGGVAEAVEHGRTGFVVAPRDVAALAAHVERLTAAPDERRALGAAGRRRFERHFGHDRMVRAIEHVYTEATATKGGVIHGH